MTGGQIGAPQNCSVYELFVLARDHLPWQIAWVCIEGKLEAEGYDHAFCLETREASYDETGFRVFVE